MHSRGSTELLFMDRRSPTVLPSSHESDYARRKRRRIESQIPDRENLNDSNISLEELHPQSEVRGELVISHIQQQPFEATEEKHEKYVGRT